MAKDKCVNCGSPAPGGDCTNSNCILSPNHPDNR